MEKGVVRSISVICNLEAVKQLFKFLHKARAEINDGILKLPSVKKTGYCQKKQQFMRLALCVGRK